MDVYKNLNGTSQVHSYEINDNQIIVRFADGATYRYTNQSVGSVNLAQLKLLATSGRGLQSYINSTPGVRTYYAEKYFS